MPKIVIYALALTLLFTIGTATTGKLYISSFVLYTWKLQ